MWHKYCLICLTNRESLWKMEHAIFQFQSLILKSKIVAKSMETTEKLDIERGG